MKKKVLIVVISIIALIEILWIGGVIPKIIGINTSKKYVNQNYSDSIKGTEKNNNESTTEPYIPSGMDVADGNEINNASNAKEYNREVENVKLEIKEGTLSNTGATVIITDKNENQYGWGVSYFIEVNKNGKWTELENLLDFAWEEIAYQLDENGQYEQEINWKVLYGKLKKGNYRLGKSVYDNGYINFYVEFTIE